MKKDPLVSVVIPVFNCEKYIENCLRSIVEQSYRNLEIIIINDGSIDCSEKIIREKFAADPRIHIIDKKKEGVSVARNLGIELSRGDFITFIDGDDFVERKFIEEALNYIKTYNLNFILGGTQRFSKSEICNYTVRCDEDIIVYLGDLQILKEKVLSNGIVEDRRLDKCFTSGPVCKVFTRESIASIRFNPELTIGEDTIFNLEVLENCNCVGVVPNIWYHYRENEQSATKAYNPMVKEQCERTLELLQEKFTENNMLKPYLRVRAIQQLHGVLILYPLHSQSKMPYVKIRKFIKNMLKEEPWYSLLCKDKCLDLPLKGIDKVLSVLCSLQAIDLIYVVVRVRLILKAAKRGKNGN